MGGNSREGRSSAMTILDIHSLTAPTFSAGGKAKPLKAPKKEKKDMDDDEIAYRDKQKAGTLFLPHSAARLHRNEDERG